MEQLFALDLRLLVMPVVWILVEALKRLIGVDSRWLPWLALVVGAITAGLAIGWTTQALFAGIILGAVAAGIYDLTKVFNNR